MEAPAFNVMGFAAALGLGLLIGSERERSKGQGPGRAVAGIRTFTLASLTGAIGITLGDLPLVALGVVVGLLVVVGYQRTRHSDPGMTTEIALITTYLLGAWSIRQPGAAVGVGVVVAIVLAARPALHRFVQRILTDQEVHDGLLLAAAALVVLPLVPDEPVDPWGVVVPRKLWMLVVLLMAINALGYVALRTLGTRLGLPIAGLVSGFVSSTATIGAMGARAKERPALRRSAVAGAALSSVATILQLAIVVGLTHPPSLRALALPLIAAGVAAVIYGGIFTWRSARESDGGESSLGRPFDPKTALVFMAILGVALVGSALLTRWLGTGGLLLGSAVAGFADAHAAAISAVSVARGGDADIDLAALAVLAGFSSNTISKTIAAFSLGGRRFLWEIAPGLLLMAACAWGAYFLA